MLIVFVGVFKESQQAMLAGGAVAFVTLAYRFDLL